MIEFTKGSSILNDFTGCEYWECWTEDCHYMIWELPAEVLGCSDPDCPLEYTPPSGATHYYRLVYRSTIEGPRVYTHVADTDTLEEAQRLAREGGGS